MTLFIDVDDAARLFTLVGIRRAIREMAAYIEADYSRWAQFDKSPRTANHSADGVIELMPTDDGQQYSFKYVNGHPDNGQRDLLTVMAFGVLADVHSGYPTLLCELTLTTAVRTAATSALVARSLARPGSTSMAIIGNGAQSEFQALAFHEMLGINEIRIFDIDRDASLKLKHNLAAFPEIEVILAGSVKEAVKGAHIVTTVTADKTYATILTPEMIEPGVHINAVGGDCPGKTELHRHILERADARVVVEYEPQSRIEGEIQQMPASFAVTELTRVLSGEA